MQKMILNSIDEVDENFEDFIEGKKKGVIQLAVPAANISAWYGKNVSLLTEATGLTTEEIEQVMYYTKYLIDGKLYSEAEYYSYKEEHPTWVPGQPLMGAPALQALVEKVGDENIAKRFDAASRREKELMAELEEINEEAEKKGLEYVDIAESAEDDEDEIASLRERHFAASSELKDVRDSLDAYAQYKTKGMSNLFIYEINLFPLQMRAILKEQINNSPYMVMHDVCTLYAKIVSRNERVLRLTELKAPEIILRNEKRMLQEGIDDLIRNGMRGKPSTKSNGEPYVSIADILLMNTTMF